MGSIESDLTAQGSRSPGSPRDSEPESKRARTEREETGNETEPMASEDMLMELGYGFTRALEDVEIALSWYMAAETDDEEFTKNPATISAKILSMFAGLRQSGRYQPEGCKTQVTGLSSHIVGTTRQSLLSWSTSTRSNLKILRDAVDRLHDQMLHYNMLAPDTSGCWIWKSSVRDWCKYDAAKSTWLDRQESPVVLGISD